MKKISIKELREMGVSTFSVKDNSPRGIHNAYLGEVKIGDKVAIDNHFVTVVANDEKETKCKNCGTTISVEKGQEKICDDCWQYREEMKEEARLIGLEVKRNVVKYMAQGMTEKEAIEKALMKI